MLMVVDNRRATTRRRRCLQHNPGMTVTHRTRQSPFFRLTTRRFIFVHRSNLSPKLSSWLSERKKLSRLKRLEEQKRTRRDAS